MMLELDYSQRQFITISNDAFSFLYFEEEPLDEENIKEANDIVEA